MDTLECAFTLSKTRGEMAKRVSFYTLSNEKMHMFAFESEIMQLSTTLCIFSQIRSGRAVFTLKVAFMFIFRISSVLFALQGKEEFYTLVIEISTCECPFTLILSSPSVNL